MDNHSQNSSLAPKNPNKPSDGSTNIDAKFDDYSPDNSQRNARYSKYVKAVTPSSAAVSSLFNAFWVGGLTCVIAQIIFQLFTLAFPALEPEFVAGITSMTIITVAILFTGFGFYDVIARKGGAGSFLPITGFANAMASASMEFKTEGLIMGTSVKLFSVVGPVIVNGIVWSAVVGLIHYLITIIF